jgi:uncharacterized protein (TIGR02246 family)
MAMNVASTERRDFVAYPTNRVVGTVTDAAKAREAIGALLQAGFRQDAIDLLQGETGLHRLDHTGAEHGFLAQFQRTVIRAFDLDEFKHLTHHIEDIRAGRCVLMVLAKGQAQRSLAADILHQHGAQFVGFYGRWAWADLPPHRQDKPEDIPAAFARAWNAHDAEALASLFDEDAEFVNVTGICWHDRESIRKGHAEGGEPIFNSSTLAIDDMKVKLLAPNVALVHARMTCQCAPDSEQPAQPRTTIVSFVAHQLGERWLCAAAHNTGLSSEQIARA